METSIVTAVYPENPGAKATSSVSKDTYFEVLFWSSLVIQEEGKADGDTLY